MPSRMAKRSGPTGRVHWKAAASPRGAVEAFLGGGLCGGSPDERAAEAGSVSRLFVRTARTRVARHERQFCGRARLAG